jgi:PAS domain S-box-containing protein
LMLAGGRSERFLWIGQFFALTSGLIGGVSIIGHLYGEVLLYHGTWHTAVSLPAALGLLLLAVATLSLKSSTGLLSPFRSDSIGGAMARRILPTVLLLTPALGWLTLVGLRRMWFDPDLAIALLVTSLTLTLTVVLWVNARLVNRLAAAHSQAVAGARQMELRRSAVVESALDAIITVDSDMRIVEFNSAAERMFGCSRANVLGGPLDPLMPESGARNLLALIEREDAAAPGDSRIGKLETVHGRRADGTEFPLEASVSRIRIGRTRYVTAILRDISVRIEAEEALRRENQFREHVIENAGLAVVSVDLAGNYLMVSPRFCDIIGKSMEQTLGTSFRELVYPEDLPFTEAMSAGSLLGVSLRYV